MGILGSNKDSQQDDIHVGNSCVVEKMDSTHFLLTFSNRNKITFEPKLNYKVTEVL